MAFGVVWLAAAVLLVIVACAFAARFYVRRRVMGRPRAQVSAEAWIRAPIAHVWAVAYDPDGKGGWPRDTRVTAVETVSTEPLVQRRTIMRKGRTRIETVTYVRVDPPEALVMTTRIAGFNVAMGATFFEMNGGVRAAVHVMVPDLGWPFISLFQRGLQSQFEDFRAFCEGREPAR